MDPPPKWYRVLLGARVVAIPEIICRVCVNLFASWEEFCTFRGRLGLFQGARPMP